VQDKKEIRNTKEPPPPPQNLWEHNLPIVPCSTEVHKEELCDAVVNGTCESYYIQGDPGTGKTYMVNNILIPKLEANKLLQNTGSYQSSGCSGRQQWFNAASVLWLGTTP